MNDEAERLRDAIRKHMSARGHDRCWENDLELYVAAGLQPPSALLLPEREEFLSRCRDYYERMTTG